MKKYTLQKIILGLLICVSNFSFSQNAEYLVEINTENGSFQAVGSSFEDINLIYTDRQCKDEVNQRYIFGIPDGVGFLVTADIHTGEVIFMNEYNFQQNFSGFYCVNGCDTLVMFNLNQPAGMHYVALYDNTNNQDLGIIGDSIPASSFWGFDYHVLAYDQLGDELYMLNALTYEMNVMKVPSGDIVENYQLSTIPEKMVYDELNQKLFGIFRIDYQTLQLSLFNTTTGDFEQLGDPFSFDYGNYHTISVDGNNNRIFYTIANSIDTGSSVLIIDALTGDLINQIFTTGSPNQALGGQNTLNGLYYSSTDEFISLHWGQGNSLTTFNVSEDGGFQIYPNPSIGKFQFTMQPPSVSVFSLAVYDINGKLLYEEQNVMSEQQLELNLPDGIYSLQLSDRDGKTFTSRLVIQN
ncbi:MAG: T9SS type A sorting domain-containing protein [Bacteroidota bacterium]